MVVSDFNKFKLDFYRENCNFVNDEIQIFEMRSQGIGLEAIAEKLNRSVKSVKKISSKVNRKIDEVSNYM